jgi:phosphoribosyl 1,2-cyclic phosphodiesterase
MRLHVCGVRGSTPAPGVEFATIGGHTSCIAIAADATSPPTLILDAGTGLRRVGTLLNGTPFDGTILLGHLHWDHTHGLPFFPAGDQPDARVRVLVPEQGRTALELLAQAMSPPAFPITPEELRGEWSFDSIDEGAHQIEGFDVLAREIPHKGGRTFGYRVTRNGRSFAYLSDHAPHNLGPGPRGVGALHAAALELVDGVDLLVHDAQYTAAELPARASFGHAAMEYAVGLAEACRVPHVLLFHHEPSRTDVQVDSLVRALDVPRGLCVTAARETTVIDL